MDKSPKNAPTDLKNPYGVVVVIGNIQQTQYIITDSVYFRTATNTWKNDWKTLATTDAINQINSSISVLSQAISDASTIASKANGLASQAQATAYQGLRFMGDIKSDYLYQVQTPGIYNLAGKQYIDWKNQKLWGNYVVIDAGGGVVQQFIYNNTNNCWVQTCNSWGNTGFKSIY